MTVVRLATFNIRRGLGLDSATNLERTAKTIRATGAQLIAMQELDRRKWRSGMIDQPAKLAELTGMKVHFWPTVRRWLGGYGIALAVRGRAEMEFRALPSAGREEPRGAIVGRAAGLGIIAAHVATQRGRSHLRQLEAIASMAAELEAPVVVLGDLNAPRRELDGLRAAGFDPGPEIVTFGGRRPRQIDYILVGPGARLVRLWTVPSEASDHLPLVADVAID